MENETLHAMAVVSSIVTYGIPDSWSVINQYLGDIRNNEDVSIGKEKDFCSRGSMSPY